jgi:hypothetical protein
MTTPTDAEKTQRFEANCVVALDLIEALAAGDSAKVNAYLDVCDRGQLRALALNLMIIVAAYLDADQRAEIREVYDGQMAGL